MDEDWLRRLVGRWKGWLRDSDEDWLSRIVEWLRNLREQQGTEPVDAAIERTQQVQLILETLNELPRRHVEAFILYYLPEMRHREIAERLKVKNGRARDLAFEARQKLQRKLVLPYLTVEIHSEPLPLDPENPGNLEVRLHNDASLSVPNLKVKLQVGEDRLGQQTVRVRPGGSVVVKGFSSWTACGAQQILTVTLTVGREKEVVFTGLWPKPGLQSLARKT
jgi:Sigma-70, region 4